MTNTISFDKNGWMTGELPENCINQCSGTGQRDADVEFWQNKLNFLCPRGLAIKYLLPFGAWSNEELGACNDIQLAQKVLWIACGDMAESGEWLGLVH